MRSCQIEEVILIDPPATLRLSPIVFSTLIFPQAIIASLATGWLIVIFPQAIRRSPLMLS